MKNAALRMVRSRAVEFLYPESDGKPMGETDQHRSIIIYLIEALKLWFATGRNVYVSGNLMMYYVEGDTDLSLSPDVFVVKGVQTGDRRVYKLWEEKAPCVVIEVSSRSTKAEDLNWKFELYRDVLRVAEYYIYDPLREYLPAGLRAWALRHGRFIERRVSGGRIRSRELELDLVDAAGRLLLVDPETARTLPGLRESEAARAEAEAARARAETAQSEAEAARARAKAALDHVTQENRELREELDRLRHRQGR
jgi:Uma2 family endonuclease